MKLRSTLLAIALVLLGAVIGTEQTALARNGGTTSSYSINIQWCNNRPAMRIFYSDIKSAIGDYGHITYSQGRYKHTIHRIYFFHNDYAIKHETHAC